MPALFARITARLGLMATALASLALLSACETSAPTGQATGSYNATPVAVALLVPSGSGAASDDLIAAGLENAARMAIADLGAVQVGQRLQCRNGT